MKKLIYSFCVIVSLTLMVLAAGEDTGHYSLMLPPDIAEEFRSLFQQEKYAEAEALYLKKVNDPTADWAVLLKMKQGKIEEGIDTLKKKIEKQKTPEERVALIKKYAGLVNDVSPELGLNFLGGYDKDLESDIDIVCFRARHFMMNQNFDKAGVLIEKLLAQHQQFSGSEQANAENALYLMVSFLNMNGKIKEALDFFDLLSKEYPKIRLDAGMQLLWASIAARDRRGVEALKKIDWVEATFPDHCKKNPHMLLLTKAQAFEAVGDIAESKKLLLQLEELIRKNPKYSGLTPMVQAKLTEYRQKEEAVELQRNTWEEATKYPYGVTEEELVPPRWDWVRITVLSIGALEFVVAIILCLTRKR